MANWNVEIPQLLLLDKRLTASDKLVWMMLQLDRVDHPGPKLASPTRLADRTHLSRVTIYNSLQRLAATGWCNAKYPVRNGAKRNDRFAMPANLLRSTALLPRDIVLYGLLKAGPFRQQGEFTYPALSRYAQLDVKTVRLSIQALTKTGWITTQQAKLRAPIQFRLTNPRNAYRLEIERRLYSSQFRGEAIGREMVLFLLQPVEFAVNMWPSWLTSPTTGALMQLDLYIPKYELAMEFQGQQHFHETEFSTAEEVARQQNRDAEKAQLLKDHHTSLLELKDDDLSIDKVRMKLLGLGPLRDLEGLEPIQYYLDSIGRRYQQKAQEEKTRRAAQKLAAEQAQQAQHEQAQTR